MIIEALSSTSQIELINKKKFTKVVLDKNSETFVVYVAALVATGADGINVHPSQVPQLVTLQWDKILIKIPTKYTDYPDLFLINLTIEFPKNTSINEHAIKLIEYKQP